MRLTPTQGRFAAALREVIDEFDGDLSLDDITAAFRAVSDDLETEAERIDR